MSRKSYIDAESVELLAGRELFGKSVEFIAGTYKLFGERTRIYLILIFMITKV
ncbi:MAG: hypothetical protein II453_21025 [Alphaproteobacteria bacterium]|nr:hypothetical protein [Alphaproteobacteria bacterium]